MNIACKRKLKSMRHTISEAIMKNTNLTMDTFRHRRWNLPVLVFFLVVLGIFFTSVDSSGQPVPPRSQTLQLIRPLVPSPEPPIEKKIRENKQAIEKNRRDLRREVEIRTLRQQQLFSDLPTHSHSFPARRKPQMTREEEIKFLEERIQALQKEFNSLTLRLNDLKKQSSKGTR